MALNSSPYAKTPQSGRFLSYYVHRRIPIDTEDSVMVLPSPYETRPDLLALQLYGTEELWWVIPQRNGLEDPVFGLRAGMLLFVPSPSFVNRVVSR